MLLRPQRHVLLIAAALTIGIWILPPIQRQRQIMNFPTPLDIGPTFRTELQSEHVWLWQLRPHQEIWFGLLIARTVGLLTMTGVALAALRQTHSSRAISPRR
jgi:hypothetical protein